jgi:hypothetical protein
VYCKDNLLSGNLLPHREAAIRDRPLFRVIGALLIYLMIAPPPVGATDLRPEAARGFDQYVHLTEQRMRDELVPGGVFLWVDGLPEPRRSETYARLQHGEVVSDKLRTADPSGASTTPGAMIHHWVGIVFIPGATLAEVLAVVEDYDRHSEYYKPDVDRSKLVEHAGDNFKVFYRLRKKKIVTIILDTDYDVHRHSLGAARAYSDSHSTRIAQVEHPGETEESELPPGKDEGFLWRLNSYWRYFDSGGGVYVQCEAISLTRDIPSGLNWLIAPFIESVPKESLEFTLQSTRSAVQRGGSRAGK